MSGTWASGWVTNDVVTASEFKKGIGAVYDTTVTGSVAANIDITSIPSGYTHLKLELYARGDTVAVNTQVWCRFNNDTAANYYWQRIAAAAATVTGSEGLTVARIEIGQMPAASATANLFSTHRIGIDNYANATNKKSLVHDTICPGGTATGTIPFLTGGGYWTGTAAINQITLLPAAGNFAIGTRATLYVMGA